MALLHYRSAIRMAEAIAPLPGADAMSCLSRMLDLKLTVEGLDYVPASGGFILTPSHPTGIADGVAVFDALKTVRPDMAIFANRDAIRAAPGLGDLLIPVEWRSGEKSYAKSRATLEATARAFDAGRAVVLFPSGRIAFRQNGVLTERPWQVSAVTLARRYGVPIVPMDIRARNSSLFYLLSRVSTDLRDITVFHEFLNKKRAPFAIRVGRPIPPEALEGDPAVVTVRLQRHTVESLRADPDAVFG